MKRQRVLMCAALALCLGASANANAAFAWTDISGSGYNLGPQLSLVVGGSGSSLTLTFMNNVGIASSITDIYIDAPPPGGGQSPNPYFLTGPTITSSSGVSFTPSAAPPNLPGGNAYPWDFVAAVSADSTSPNVPANGINVAGEWLTLAYTLAGPTTVNDVIADLANGQFRVGLHIQALPNGNSTSFITTPVPEPSTIIAGALLLIPFAGSMLRFIPKRRA